MLDSSLDQRYRGTSLQHVQRISPPMLHATNKPPTQMIGRQNVYAANAQHSLSSHPGSVHQVQQNTSLVLHTATNNTNIAMGGSQHPHTANSQRPPIPYQEQLPKKIRTVSVGTQTCQEHQTDYGISHLPSNLTQISSDLGHKSSMELLISKMKSVNFQDQVCYLCRMSLCQHTLLSNPIYPRAFFSRLESKTCYVVCACNAYFVHPLRRCKMFLGK